MEPGPSETRHPSADFETIAACPQVTCKAEMSELFVPSPGGFSWLYCSSPALLVLYNLTLLEEDDLMS